MTTSIISNRNNTAMNDLNRTTLTLLTHIFFTENIQSKHLDLPHVDELATQQMKGKYCMCDNANVHNFKTMIFN